MITEQWYCLVMEFMDEFIAEMEEMSESGSFSMKRMKREHARFLIVILYGAILSLINGGNDLVSISLACQIFEDFHDRQVEGAARLIGVWKGQRLDEYVKRKYKEFSEDVVLEATELDEEKAHARGWFGCLQGAFVAAAKRPERDRTPDSVRKLFVDRVNTYNSVESRNGSDFDRLELAELEDTYRKLIYS